MVAMDLALLGFIHSLISLSTHIRSNTLWSTNILHLYRRYCRNSSRHQELMSSRALAAGFSCQWYQWCSCLPQLLLASCFSQSASSVEQLPWQCQSYLIPSVQRCLLFYWVTLKPETGELPGNIKRCDIMRKMMLHASAARALRSHTGVVAVPLYLYFLSEE